MDSGRDTVPSIVNDQRRKNGIMLLITERCALLTYLSKAFDCVSYDLLIAKLNAYGFIIAALRLVQDYLSNRRQGTEINSYFSF